MKKVYYLGTCDTCGKIIKELKLKEKGFSFQDIKTEKICATQLDELKAMAGTYEALFSRVAMKYKSLGLKDKTLNEKDYRNYILEEYTFLKRPVIVSGKKIFIGNTKSVIAEAAATL
jgi:arsenate reductase (glutaredoxin)